MPPFPILDHSITLNKKHMQKTLGGDRLGSGKKLKVHLHGYERSTHDLGYLWRSTMSSGTLVPFMSEVALPGDTFDINLDCDIKTHPTIGPLFGSYKVQLDVFQAPLRLYNQWLHNNMLGIGRDMSQVKLPLIQLTCPQFDIDAAANLGKDIDNIQINPSCILAYLGIRGVGIRQDAQGTRKFNAVPLIAYWDIYKNYYANKQEEIGAVIHTPSAGVQLTVTSVHLFPDGTTDVTLSQSPASSPTVLQIPAKIEINWAGTQPLPNTILLNTNHGQLPADALFDLNYDGTSPLSGNFLASQWGWTIINNWEYISVSTPYGGQPEVVTFDLADIDTMRNDILSSIGNIAVEITSASTLEPYKWLAQLSSGIPNTLSNQEGLGLKTYQSDLFNNWLQTEWIDGPGGISEVTAVDTTGGSFTMDQLLLSRKVYDMLNRIAVSGGSYDDWLDAVYTHNRYQRCETPMYMGGLIKELVFQEVVSSSESEEGGQPLGTLAGKGVMSKKHKGGTVVIKVDEPSYIIGIISLTPRLDYSQGNKWDVNLLTMDDLHKPALDEIGFQELITEQMAWWSTEFTGGVWVQRSAGKQPAWINYMTNVNQTRGNFAISSNEMFMTLNRRYECEPSIGRILDLTTYIDPAKFNFIFAQTSLDSQNFWAQIAVDITARRKMSAKVMPNL